VPVLEEEEIVLKCHGVVAGRAEGEALVATEPISFWGGIDPATGRMIDKKSGSFGKNISGKVLVFPYGKGSSTSSAVFLEAVRCNKAPVAIVNVQTEPLLAVGVILAMRLYGKSIPVVDHVEKNPCEVIANQDFVEVDADKGILVVKRARQIKEGLRVG
jgi:predicted aconitase with swiveling domain